MTDKPLVSVRLMVYNNQSFINQCIESILAQKTDFLVEVIVGDDFSSDNSLEIINSYKSTNNVKIKVLKRPLNGEYWNKRKSKDGSVKTNFIDILENCKGKYIALLDGDDYWLDSNKLQKQVDFLEKNNDYFFVSANSEVLSNNNIYRTNLEGDLSFEDFITGNKLGRQTSAFLFRNDGVACFIESLKRYNWPFNDLLLIFWCMTKGKGRVLEDLMVCYRIHENGIWTSTNQEQRFKNFIIFYSLLLKSEINKSYNISSFNKSIDWIIKQIKVVNQTTKIHKNISRKILSYFKKILKTKS